MSIFQDTLSRRFSSYQDALESIKTPYQDTFYVANLLDTRGTVCAIFKTLFTFFKTQASNVLKMRKRLENLRSVLIIRLEIFRIRLEKKKRLENTKFGVLIGCLENLEKRLDSTGQ